MRETATPALPRRTKGPTAAPVPARRRSCVTYVSTLPGHDAEGPQRLVDDYAAAHGLDVVARFVDHGSGQPAGTPGLRNALDAIGADQAEVLLAMTLCALAGERDAVCAEVASVRGTVVFVGWPSSESSDGSASPREAVWAGGGVAPPRGPSADGAALP